MSVITEISAKLGIDTKVVGDYYNKTMEELRRAGIPEAQLVARADMITVAYFRAGKRSNAEIFEGLLTEVEPANTMQAKRVEKAMKAYQENSDKAIAEGFIKIINGLPVAVDNIKYFSPGTPQQKENRNFGKPLDPNATTVNLCGYFDSKGQTKKWVMRIPGDVFGKIKLAPNLPVRFSAVHGPSIDADTARLYATGFNGFEVISDRATGFNVLPLIEKLYSHLSVPVERVEEVAKQFEGQFGKKILVKGIIDEINLSPSSGGKPNLSMSSISTNVTDMTRIRVSLSDFWREQINFAPFSTVYVLGSPWVFAPEGRDKMVGITAHNIVVVDKIPLPVMAPITSANVPSVPKTDGKFDEFTDSEFGKVK